MKKHTKDTLLILLLFATIGLVVYSANSCNDRVAERIKDRLEQQEMIDYHRSQGREIIIFE